MLTLASNHLPRTQKGLRSQEAFLGLKQVRTLESGLSIENPNGQKYIVTCQVHPVLGSLGSVIPGPVSCGCLEPWVVCRGPHPPARDNIFGP